MGCLIHGIVTILIHGVFSFFSVPIKLYFSVPIVLYTLFLRPCSIVRNMFCPKKPWPKNLVKNLVNNLVKNLVKLSENKYKSMPVSF